MSPCDVGAGPDTPLPREVEARIVGRADDGDSLECLVVAIDGTTDRPDGSTYHITWSLGPGRKARESNDVLRDKGWDRSRRADPGRARAGALLMPHLFLDCDGVLADFDAGAKHLLGMTPRAFEARHGKRRILEAARQRAEFLRHAAGDARRAAAVRRGQAS